jgi:hypothetical protein
VIVTITAAAIYGLVRFRVPAEVSLVVLTAVAVDALLVGRPTATVGDSIATSAPAANR